MCPNNYDKCWCHLGTNLQHFKDSFFLGYIILTLNDTHEVVKRKLKFTFISGITNSPPTSSIVQFQVGERTQPTIPPKSFWQSQFTQEQPKFVKFNLSIDNDAVLGVYGRRGVAPSVAQFDFFEVIDGRTLSGRSKRAAKVGNSVDHLKLPFSYNSS